MKNAVLDVLNTELRRREDANESNRVERHNLALAESALQQCAVMLKESAAERLVLMARLQRLREDAAGLRIQMARLHQEVAHRRGRVETLVDEDVDGWRERIESIREEMVH